MKKNIVIINGTGGSGKDIFVNFCSKYCTVFNSSSIYKIKKIATLMGWDGQKDEKSRKFLSDLKFLASQYNDMPFRSICKDVEKFKSLDAQIMFIHIREPEEIKRAVQTFGAKTILIKRKGLKNIESNSADANVDNYNYDYIIENTTVEKLNQSAKDFVENIIRSTDNKFYEQKQEVS